MPETFREMPTKKPLFNVALWLRVTVGLYAAIALIQAVVGLWIIPGIDLVHGVIITSMILSLANDSVNYRRIPVYK